jgi:hypothetical protein
MRPAVLLALLVALSWSTLACGVFQHVNVEPVATSFQKPSNVAVYVAVRDGDEPLTELEPSNFHVYENEQLVPSDQTQLTLLDRNLGAAHHALLLIDMSAAQTPAARTLAAKGATGFVEKLVPLEGVSVYAFDGAESLVQIATVNKGGQIPSMAALEGFTPRDKSRNLNGAVLAALGKLDAALAQTGKPVTLGTLVVFANGPDVAGRVDADKLHDAVWESPHDVIAVGVGERAESLEPIARHGLVRAQAESTLPIALEEAASKARGELEKYYLVSYCSPARAGERRLRLEVKYTNKQGEEHSGDFETDFSAKGFGPGCNSQATPRLTRKPKVSAFSTSESSGKESSESSKGKKPPADSKEHDQGEDAPVAPPESSDYAK